MFFLTLWIVIPKFMYLCQIKIYLQNITSITIFWDRLCIELICFRLTKTIKNLITEDSYSFAIHIFLFVTQIVRCFVRLVRNSITHTPFNKKYHVSIYQSSDFITVILISCMLPKSIYIVPWSWAGSNYYFDTCLNSETSTNACWWTNIVFTYVTV